MEQKKKVRLSDIAHKLNISTVTVSKALTEKEGVSDELRQEIKTLAINMGYKIKKVDMPLAKNNATGNIGILIPSRFFSPDFSYYWYLFNFLSSELLKNNYFSIMELLSDKDEENLTLPKMINDKKIDGLIVLGQTNDKYLEKLHSNFSRIILLDFYTNKLNLDSVSNDDYYSSYILTNYVISQGHKNIRFVGNFEATTSIADRFMGFQKAMYENHLQVNIEQIIKDRDEKGRRIPLLLPLDDMPTAFVCNCDETAACLIDELQQNGFKVPNDISVTGFDNFLPNGRTNVELTTFFINPENSAKIAAQLIISKITGKNYNKGRHLVCGEILIRNSVKKI